jgi:hypothetical protein
MVDGLMLDRIIIVESPISGIVSEVGIPVLAELTLSSFLIMLIPSELVNSDLCTITKPQFSQNFSPLL